MSIRDLKFGMSGEDVRAVQQGLNTYFGDRRPPVETTGYFGQHTLDAVNAFQAENPGTGGPNGMPDGTVGKKTRHAIFSLAAVTINVVGFRMGNLLSRNNPGTRFPDFSPGHLTLGGPPQPELVFNPNANVLNIDWDRVLQPARLDFTPQRFPGLRLPLPTPGMYVAPPPMVPTLTPSPSVFPMPIHHFELSPGSQTMMPNPSQTSFTLSLQVVGMIGDDNAAHQEIATGFQLGSPNADGSGAWSLSWYAQITDVDRIGHYGRFHLWQPYAQIGAQSPLGSFRPLLTGNVAPINVVFDITDNLSVNIAGVIAMKYDPVTGAVQAGVQGTSGLVLKFGGPPAQH